MNENTKIQILQKLISEKEIKKQLRLRKKEFVYQSISKTDSELFQQLMSDGWELYKEFKTKYKLQKQKQIDVLFEDKVWSLLASLGFKVMNLDRSLNIPYEKQDSGATQQIDVLAKDDESILIVECKATSNTNKTSEFKQALEAYKLKIAGIRNSLKEIFPEKKLKIKFILATENYNLSKNDENRLHGLNGVHLDEEQIEYFTKMHSQIGLAARYQFLGNIFQGQDIPEMDNQIPAIRGKMGGHTYYSFSIEPEKLLKIGYVLHRNKANINMMPTYQRVIKNSRLKSIHSFIEDSKGYFPNSIIINLDTNNKDLEFNEANTKVKSSISSVGILHLPKRYRSAFIIDGQHRLYGYANSVYKNTNSIPVIAFTNLEREEQIKLFMQINENQKAVSRNLQNTLNSDLLWTSEYHTEKLKALRARLAISLGESRSSSLYDRISIGEDNKDITQQAFENALKKTNFFGTVSKKEIQELGTFYNGDLDACYTKLYTLLEKSFNYIQSGIPEIWNSQDNIVVINRGIYAIIKLISDIVDHLLEHSLIQKNTTPSNIFEECKTFLDPVIVFFQEMDEETENSLRKAYGGNGDTKYWRTLQLQVVETHESFNPTGLNEYLKREAKEYNTRAFEIIRDLETFFKKDFQEKLKLKFGSSWFKKGLPPQTAKKANELAFDKNLQIEDEQNEVAPWDCLTIIAYRQIALKNWKDCFDKPYTMPSEIKKSGKKEDKTQWMVKLERLRNENFHQYSVTEEEFNFLQELHDWLIVNN